MRGIDTNILLRFLLQDDSEQAAKATRFINGECTSTDPGLINHIVLCELVWVLESSYRFPRRRILNVLDDILRAEQLKIDQREEVRAAILEYQEGADFPDSLIGIVNLRLGCDDTLTFDRKAAQRSGFRAL
jgi:predicted nucleic-acid-binding protein